MKYDFIIIDLEQQTYELEFCKHPLETDRIVLSLHLPSLSSQ